MKLIYFDTFFDFGKNVNISLFKHRRKSLVDIDFSWNDYPGIFYASVSSGLGSAFRFTFSFYRLDLSISLFNSGC